MRDELKGSRILALNAADGKLKWQKTRQSMVSYCTPVVWDTSEGKQVVVAGLGRMIGYDLKTGEEKWYVVGMPAGPCASPLVADGTLFYAGWSPGGPDDKERQMPSFNALLKQSDADKDGALSKDEIEKSPLKDSFDNLDMNKDGKITRDEWDRLLKLIASGRSSAFALSSSGTGEISRLTTSLEENQGVAVHSIGARLPRPDGHG